MTPPFIAFNNKRKLIRRGLYPFFDYTLFLGMIAIIVPLSLFFHPQDKVQATNSRKDDIERSKLLT